MLLVIDNFDSFVHNLARYFERLGQETFVVRNHAIDEERVRAMRPDAVVLSPGPCTPTETGASLRIVRALHRDVPMLGVCLGHQTIAEALGGRVVRSPKPVHGETTEIHHDGTGLFAELASPLTVCRYHSLAVDQDSLPDTLRATARTGDGTLMAFEHYDLPVYGVQFHPEAILTECGYELLANFLRLAGLKSSADAIQLAASERPPLSASAQPIPAGPVTY